MKKLFKKPLKNYKKDVSMTDFLDQVKDLNQEKKEIIRYDDSTMVVANPGTGKTKLLSYKYIYLLKQGLETKDILCLTFTEKASQEMQDRILKLIEEEQIKVDYSQIKIMTFHSFALDNLEENDIISSNLLRYEIYTYLIENQVFTYQDNYLLETIVPKIENAIRYIKSFGVTPEKLNKQQIKEHITDYKNYEKQELENYLEHFINIYKRYEEYKQKKGLDYTDLLINFLKQKQKPTYKWVLVDELQDVNNMEADIVLQVCLKYLVVGDKKQAIFGFQGGSITNFLKFKEAKEFILSDNFRSTDQILNYAKNLYLSKTKDQEHIEEVKNLKNADKKQGPLPQLLSVKKNKETAVVNKIKELLATEEEIAVVTRTNGQLIELSKELEINDIDYSSTYLTSSKEARTSIICFLTGLLSKDIEPIKASMFTPFFPINYQKAPGYKQIRERIHNTNDLEKLFKEIILPLSIAYGRDYTLSCINMQQATIEALETLDQKTIENLCYFLQSAEQLAEEVTSKTKVTLTTTHKAKGKQYQTVIYVPKTIPDKDNFQDAVTTAILKSKEIDPKQELEEETRLCGSNKS